MTKFRITCRDYLRRSCQYIWEITLEALIRDRYGAVYCRYETWYWQIRAAVRIKSTRIRELDTSHS